MQDREPIDAELIRVVTARAFYISDIVQIAVATGLSEWSAADYTNEINRKDSIFLVAADSSENVFGFVVGRQFTDDSNPANSFAEIYNIAVQPSLVRKGIGTKLLGHFVSILQDLDIIEVFLEVRSKNLRAFEFYRSSGFEVSGIRKSYYVAPVDDAIVMKSTL